MSGVLLLNGPNLGRLGQRKPDIYGTATLLDIERMVTEVIEPAGFRVIAIQSDSEAELMAALNRNRDVVGAIINPGALMMYGWSLRDALEDFDAPWIEVHLSNIWSREPFRHASILSPLASAVFAGAGPFGYVAAARFLLHRHAEQSSSRGLQPGGSL